MKNLNNVAATSMRNWFSYEMFQDGGIGEDLDLREIEAAFSDEFADQKFLELMKMMYQDLLKIISFNGYISCYGSKKTLITEQAHREEIKRYVCIYIYYAVSDGKDIEDVRTELFAENEEKTLRDDWSHIVVFAANLITIKELTLALLGEK